jgi:hypothetical protein
LAGHSSLSVTQKYIQTTPQLLHKAISLLWNSKKYENCY